MPMRIKSWMILALVLALAVAALPMGALAAAKSKPSIRLPARMGLMPLGATVTLVTKLRKVDAGQLSYHSSDAGVVSVTPSGELHAASTGRAVITVSGGGVKAKMGIVVLPLGIRLKAGESLQLPRGKTERYLAKDKSVATVSKKGLVTGRKAGTTVIGVKYGRQLMKIEVTVAAGESGSEPSGADSADSKAAKLAAAAATDQIVLVEYDKGSKATLSVHEKQGGVWKQILQTPAYVGKNGIGKTKEGDKKTPVGTYNLTTPFGILADPGAPQPYTKVTKYHYWCGASSSKYYNQLCDSRVNGRKYTSSDEHLIDYKGAYNYCMFIDYNAKGVAHKGSCIFLHCFSKNKYTAGCVAISEASMKKIVRWAKPGAKIVIQ